ncbi:hypothetical protein EB796_003739 [Bugula neritina]|uniref:Uncharacterized protein n=1 Tax=Bugula neritina TaxID=10212 RepID=A0A7J7KI88_BUGNE|nr:hypothetical protein EB796_003739 [Bugula neritina]
MAETRVDSVTQTDHEPHDVFYYKSRAFKAETALLTLRKDQYFHHLDSNLKENEKETSSKLLLYSYDPDKYRQLQMDFQAQTMLTEHLKKKACDILDFNLRALNDGHELSELPLIDDDTVDLATFRLGPVTPTLAGVPGQPLFLPYPPETQENVANYSSFFGATGRCNALSSLYIMSL